MDFGEAKLLTPFSYDIELKDWFVIIVYSYVLFVKTITKKQTIQR